MKHLLIAALLFAPTLGLLVPRANTQEKQDKNDSKLVELRKQAAHLKIQVVFTEFEGEKKVKSLSYSFLIESNGTWSKVRIGTRVPVYTGGPNGGMQYIDVGTNIDCRITGPQDGRFEVNLRLERSWVEGDVSVPVDRHTASPNEDAAAGRFNQPIIRQVGSELNLNMKNGQAVDGNTMTDPISGRVTKVAVSLAESE